MNKYRNLLIFVIILISINCYADYATVSPSAVEIGDDTYLSWGGFASNVNIEVWRGGSFWVYANTNVPGNGNQTIGTSGWQIRGDYRVKVVQRNNTSIYVYSNYFSVNNPYANVSPSSVVQGNNTTANWSGFTSNVNVEVWRGGSFWVYANTNTSGNGNQTLNTTGWSIRSDYRIKVVLLSSTNIYEYSNYFAVTSPPVPPAPSLYSPSNYSIRYNQTPHSFDWSTVNGYSVDEYRIYVDNNSGFGSPEINQTPTSSNYTSYSNLSNNVYYWKVQAHNSGGWGNWSSIRQFVVDTPPNSPSITSPSNGATYTNGDIITFQWNAPSGSIERYNLRIVPGDDFNGTPVYNQEFSSTSQPIDTSGWTNSEYIWGVRAIKSAPSGYNQWNYEQEIGWGNYATRSFTINPPLPSAPTLSSPSNYEIIYNQTPYSFDWNSVAGADQYEIRVDNYENLQSPEIQAQPTSSNYTSYSAIENNVYYWSVRAHNSAGWGNWAMPARQFVIDTPPSAPSLINPENESNHIVGESINFDWSDPPENPINRSYLRIVPGTDLNGTPVYDQEITSIYQNVDTDGWLTGSYIWGVRAIKTAPAGYDQLEYEQAIGWGTYSTRTFELENPPNQAPLLIAPQIGATITSVEIIFEWSDVSADRYELLVDNNSGFGSPEVSYDRALVFPYIQETSYTLCENWLSSDVYSWKVIAYFDDRTTLESETQTFIYEPTPYSEPIWTPVYRAYKYIPPTEPNGPAQDHFYCTSDSHLAEAVGDDYEFEKVEGFVSLYPFETGSTMLNIYRLTNTLEGSHIYTTNGVQKDDSLATGTHWKYEGIIGYTFDNPDFLPMYELKLPNVSEPKMTDYFYTTSEVEKQNAMDNGYQMLGTMCSVSLDGGLSTRPWNDRHPSVGVGINPANGNFTSYTKSSFSIPGSGPSIDFAHIYNSYATRLTAMINPLGVGWTHTYNAYIYESANRYFVFWPDGSIVLFDHSYPYEPITPGVYDTFIHESDNIWKLRTKDQTVYTFEKSNPEYPNIALLQSITDRNDLTSMLTWNNGKLTYVTDPHGRQLTFSYRTTQGETHLIDHISDPIGRSIYFNYGENNDLTQFTDAEGNPTYFNYWDSEPWNHLLTDVTLPEGNSIHNNYSNHQVTQQSIGSQNFNPVYNPLSTLVTDSNGNSYNYQYEEISSNVETRIISLTTPNVVSNFQYNDANNPTLPTTVTDGNGNSTNITYDSMGNATVVNQPLGVSHQFQYNALNDITQYSDPENHNTNFGYDGNGNLTSIQTPRGTTSLTRNTDGTLNSATNPTGNTTNYDYNIYGNVTSIVDPLYNTSSFVYDDISRTISSTDPLAHTTDYNYDNNDNQTQVTDPASINTSFDYDNNDNLTSISRSGQTTNMSYNSMDLIETLTNPNSQLVQFYYQTNGQLSSKQKPNGQTVSYGYSDNGLLSSINTAGASGSISYDGNKNIQSITDNNGSMSYTYDQLNRVTNVNADYSSSKSVSYEYDDASNITAIVYPGNHRVEYDYFDDNLLQSATDWNNHTTTFQYRNDGLLETINYPNGIVRTMNYDNSGRLIDLSNTAINSYSMQLDAVGNIISEDRTEPFDFVPFSSQTINLTYDNANRILSAGDESFTNDANGNMTNRQNGTESTTYSWDGFDRLLSIIDSQNNIQFTYDLLGNRHSANRNGTTSRYVYDILGKMSNMILETDVNGNPTSFYVYAGNMLISRIKPDGTTNYYHSDYRGNVIAMTNSSGNITHKYSYDSYGKVLESEEADANPFQFVGIYGVMREDNNLSHMRARYYDASIGRFISEDPVWATNLFAYADGNPLVKIDPKGLAANSTVAYVPSSEEDYWLKYDSPLYRASGYALMFFKGVRFTGGFLSSKIGFAVGGQWGSMAASSVWNLSTNGTEFVYGAVTNDKKMMGKSLGNFAIDNTFIMFSPAIKGLRNELINESINKTANYSFDFLMDFNQ